MQRLKKARHQIIDHAHAGYTADDGAEHIDIFVCVAELLPRHAPNRCVDKVLDPVDFCLIGDQIGLASTRHRHQVADGQLLIIFIGMLLFVLWEHVFNQCIQGDQPFIDRKSHRSGGDTLAKGVERMGDLGGKWGYEGLRSDHTVA